MGAIDPSLRSICLQSISVDERSKKNHAICSSSGIHTTHESKEAAFFQHFSKMGEKETRSCTLNWDALALSTIPVVGLDNPFTTKEVWEAIKDSPAEKAPGPDGFTGVFYRKC
jgi:hypothetical protein